MSEFKFAVVLNLSNFFSDHRHRARVCIDDKIKTVEDLQGKITNIFGVQNFILTSRNEYLPHTEDIHILQSDDIIWVIPSDVSHHNEDNVERTPKYIPSNLVRKRKSCTLNNPEDSSCLKNGESNDELKIKKKKKKHSIDIDEETIIKKDKKHKELNDELKIKKKKKNHAIEIDEETIIKKDKKYEESNDELKIKEKNKDYSIDIDEETIIKKDKKHEESNNDELKKKKNHAIDMEEQTIIKKDKKHKKKHKDYEVRCLEKSEDVSKETLDYTEKKNKDSLVKNSSFPFLNKYVDTKPSVNVATSIPHRIPCKKATLIAPNTEKYLKKNKINIVKIDYIRRPTAELQQIVNGDLPEATATPMDIESGASQSDKELATSVIPEIFVSNNENSTNIEVSDELSNKELDQLSNKELDELSNKELDELSNKEFDHKKTSKISLYVPKTKYFFINTPSGENRIKPKPHKKRENVFIKEGLFSPITKKNNESDTIEINTVDLEQVNVDKSETPQEVNTVSHSQLPIDYSNTSLKVSENISEIKEGASLINENRTNLHDQQTLNETEVCNSTLDIKNKIDAEVDVSSSRSMELISELSKAVVQDSCYIDKMSLSETALLDSSVINYSTSPSMSGITPFSFSSSNKKYISGVGHIVTKLRESELHNALDMADTSNRSEFVSKRRHRIRKRHKKTKNNDLVDETITLKPTSQLTGSIKSLAAPKMHIKFSDNVDHDLSEDICYENSSCAMQQTEQNNGYSESSNICYKSDNKNEEEETRTVSIGSKSKETLEEQILKAPLLYQVLPKIGNVISFKVLKISEDFTPQVSSNIVGKVKQYSPENKLVIFKIMSGIEQFKEPKGKFSIDEEDYHSSSTDIKDLVWTDLIEPRLLFS